MTGIALPLFITASPLHDAGSSPKIGKTPGSLRALTASDSWKEKTDKTREGSEQQQSSCHWKLGHTCILRGADAPMEQRSWDCLQLKQTHVATPEISPLLSNKRIKGV